VRDQYHENRDRWNLAKCCFEQHPLRLIMQPQICPYIDIAGQFCNMTDECIENFNMTFDFREIDTSDEPEFISGQSVGLSASEFLEDPSYEVEEVPGFTFIRGVERKANRRSGAIGRYSMAGQFPTLNAYWDSIEPYQTVWVRMRLKIIPPAVIGSGSLPGSIGSLYDSNSCATTPLKVRVGLTGNLVGKDSLIPVYVPNCDGIPDDPECADPASTPTIARDVNEAILNCPADGSFFWDPYTCGGI